MAWLVAIEGDLRGRRFPLDASCLVGRGPYNHVVLDDTRISRQHAKISPEEGGHVLYDLNSANGSFINDVQVKRQRLAPNDRVRFGPFVFQFEEAVDDGRTQQHRAPHARFVPEVLTNVGSEPPSKIIESMDAAAATNPGLPEQAGLQELEEADRKLRTLYGFIKAIASTLDTAELLERIVRNLFDIFPEAQTVAVYLRDAVTGAMQPRKVLRRDEGPASASTLPGQFHEEVVRKGRAVLSAPLTAQKGKGRAAAGGVSMHAPMIFNDVVHGVLHVRAEDHLGMPFSQGDLDLLSGIAANAAMAMQNARMHQDSLKQQRLQQDLLLAEQIQKSFLPRQLPSVEGIEFVTEYRPAYSVGGDFYDVFWLNYDRIGVFVGDVSGKGVSAALLMARISSDLRLTAMIESDPAKVLGHVNRIVLERRQPDIFVTGIYLTLDVKTHRMEIANAGHHPALIRRRSAGVLERVEGGTGTAIGIFDDTDYEKVEVTLAHGDALIMCTDGVLEASNGRGEQFGSERLEACLSDGTSQASELAERLQRHLRAHVGDAAQSDDLTLIICGITETSDERRRRRDEPTESFHTPKPR